MAPGRKAKLAPHDPDNFVELVRASKVRWKPNMMPALLAWIRCLDDAHAEARIDVMSRHKDTLPAVRDGMVARIDAIRTALGLLAASSTQPWDRQRWFKCCSVVMRECGMEETAGDAGTPNPG